MVTEKTLTIVAIAIFTVMVVTLALKGAIGMAAEITAGAVLIVVLGSVLSRRDSRLREE